MLIDHDEVLNVYNQCISEAARKVRDFMLVSNPDGSESLRLTVDGLSRAMWLQDVSLARRLMRVSEVARTFAEIRDGQVFCLDPQGFENLFVEIRRSQQAVVTHKFNQQLTSASGLTERAQIKSKLQASRRFQRVFFFEIADCHFLGSECGAWMEWSR